ncbi:DUF4129 domain-containing protein [Maribacter sp. 2307ULW6-5]|uniref:DUF4129 domain-containing protein n=1 Tax=Maribacter sp. 2307ULW6-5 TaxID=3386275 RepID=UPI0039BD8F0A
MKHRFLPLYLLGHLVCTAQDSNTLAQDAELHPVTIDEDDLAPFKEDPAFDYELMTSPAPEWFLALKNWLGNQLLKVFEWIFGLERASGALSAFLELLPYVLLVLLLTLVIRFFIKANNRNILQAKKNLSQVGLGSEEQLMQRPDLQALLGAAMADQDYRLAIRYHYLISLQEMEQKGLIAWERQKTNMDYLNELTQPPLKALFKKITRWYDYIWYGDFPVDQKSYQQITPVFSHLQDLIKNG